MRTVRDRAGHKGQVTVRSVGRRTGHVRQVSPADHGRIRRGRAQPGKLKESAKSSDRLIIRMYKFHSSFRRY